MRAEIVPALAQHIAPIAENVREADRIELWASHRHTPEQSLSIGLQRSTQAFTGLVDGVPVLMFGATPYSVLRGQGIAWMIGSTALDVLANQKILLKRSQEALGCLHALYPLLFNACDARNEAAQRWLRWLGFTFLDPVPMGADGLPFIPFYRVSPCAHP